MNRIYNFAHSVVHPPLKSKILITKLILACSILLGIGLRFYKLDSESLWIDELLSINYSISLSNTLEVVKLNWFFAETNPPLYFIFIHLWETLLGHSEWILRLPSAIFGSLSLLAIFHTTKNIFNKKIALFSVIFLALNYTAIYHSQEIRSYSLYLLSSIMFFYYSYLFFSSSLKKAQLKYLFLWCFILGNTHFIGTFLVLILSFISICKNNTAKKNYVLLLILLSISPSLFKVLTLAISNPLLGSWCNGCNITGHISWFHKIDLDFFYSTFNYLFISNDIYTTCTNIKNDLVLIGLIIPLIIFAIIKIIYSFKIPAYKYLALSLTLPFSCLVLISLIYRPIILPRGVIFLIPLCSIFLSIGLSYLNKKLSLIYFIIIALCMIYHLTNHLKYYSNTKRTQYREASLYIKNDIKINNISKPMIMACRYNQITHLNYYFNNDKKIKYEIISKGADIKRFPTSSSDIVRLCSKDDWNDVKKYSYDNFWFITNADIKPNLLIDLKTTYNIVKNIKFHEIQVWFLKKK